MEITGAGAVSGLDNKPASHPTANARMSWMVITVAIIAGMFFRFTNLDRKIFWPDETVTKLALTGRPTAIEYGHLYTKQELLQTAYGIDSASSLDNVARNLVMTEAEQMPVYYILIKFWSQIFGTDPAQLRMFSAVVGLLLIAACYFFGAELFGNSLAGGLTAALVAVSPFHLTNAQQARPYSLWALFMVLTNIALLRALRNPSLRTWSLFCAALTITAYTQLFTIPYILALCAWIVVQQKFRLDATARYKGFWVSIAACCVCLIPWILMVPQHATKSNWLSFPAFTVINHIDGLLAILTEAFFDQNLFAFTIPLIQKILINGLILSAFIVLVKRAAPRISALLISLFLVPAIFILVNDIKSHSATTFYSRYSTASILAAEVCIAGSLMFMRVDKTVLRECYGAALGLVIALGMMSCFQYSTETTWHKNGKSEQYLAEMINKYQSPVVVLDDPDVHSPLVLCALLRDDARVMIFRKKLAAPPMVPFTDLFLISKSGAKRLNYKHFRGVGQLETASPTSDAQ